MAARPAASTNARRELEHCPPRIYASSAFHTYALVFLRVDTDHNLTGRSAGSSTRRAALSSPPVPVPSRLPRTPSALKLKKCNAAPMPSRL